MYRSECFGGNRLWISCALLVMLIVPAERSAWGLPRAETLTPAQFDSFLQTASTGGTNDPAAGSLETFPSSGVALLSQIPLSGFSSGTTAGNDIWGYVSPSGREYAIIGLWKSVAVVEVTDPVNPVIVGEIPGPSSTWRDMKTYGEFAYAVIDQSGLGLQVIDLRNVDSGSVSLIQTTLLNGSLFTAHNIALNEESGFAYLVATNMGALVAVDLSNPTNPQLAGVWSNHALHDVQVVSYNEGPFAGREICFGSATNAGLWIIDVTDKNNMFVVSTEAYPNVTYCHQTWLSEDRKFVYVDDELDELQNPNVNTTTTYIINVEDLDNPFYVRSFTTGLPSIDHNLMVRGDFVFEANYTSGLRIFDVSDHDDIQQVGFFDTYPVSDARNFNGAWGIYPFLPSGVVLVSDINRGLFVLDPSAALGQVTIPEPPLAAPVPFDVRRNRYVSFQPNPLNVDPMAIEISLTVGPGATGSLGWLDVPDGAGVSRIVDAPVARVWNEPLIHVADCGIVPVASYDVRYDTGTAFFSAPLAVHTIAQPAGGKFWGDTVGAFDGSAWSGPNGLVNANDFLAALQSFQVLPGSPHFTWVDVHDEVPNQVVNFTDVFNLIQAFQGQAYPFSIPQNCP